MSRAFSILAFSFLVACSANAPTDPSGKEGDDAVQESDLSGGSPKYLGQIAPGETKTTSYTDPPLYRAYGFTATGGDKITIDVKSTDYGDAMAWLTTTSWKSIAANDDASAKTLDSHIEYTIPAGTGVEVVPGRVPRLRQARRELRRHARRRERHPASAARPCLRPLRGALAELPRDVAGPVRCPGLQLHGPTAACSTTRAAADVSS